jgi:DNA-binding winged helix-turn-helix (wHTH) protein
MEQLPFPSLAQRVLTDLANGRCVALTGLSNTGKSTLMQALASPSAEAEYAALSGRAALLIYVDCNRAVAISAQAFYEVVLRSLLERTAAVSDGALTASMRRYHQAVTEAATAFSASLSFNLALTELCEGLGRDLGLLIDEFDELYTALDDRALLNLRAVQDRFHTRLLYVTATVRSLPELRGRSLEDEFAELFSRTTHPMTPLDPPSALRLLDGLHLDGLTSRDRERCVQLADGHPGLLVSTAQVLASLPEEWDGDPLELVDQEPQPRSECMKIWTQLLPQEQEGLSSLATDPAAGLPPHQLHQLEELGLLHEGEFASPLFRRFVTHRMTITQAPVEGVRIDPDSGDVWVDSVRIPVLTDLEFKLLQLLHGRRDKITDKYAIVTTVWGEEYLDEIDDARVEKLVSRLRSKIEADPSNPAYLITQRGRGYKLLSRAKRGESAARRDEPSS